MALNTITPSNREEEYLSAIAGDEGASAPVPSNRREEWLRRIARHGESIPTVPEAGDSGKVWTAGSDGTAGWETAGGGSDVVVVYPTTQPQTYTDLSAPESGYHWADDTTTYEGVTINAISLEADGAPLTASELNAMVKNNTMVIIDTSAGYGAYSKMMSIFAASTNVDLYSAESARNLRIGPTPPPAATVEAFYMTPDTANYYGVVAIVAADS